MPEQQKRIVAAHCAAAQWREVCDEWFWRGRWNDKFIHKQKHADAKWLWEKKRKRKMAEWKPKLILRVKRIYRNWWFSVWDFRDLLDSGIAQVRTHTHTLQRDEFLATGGKWTRTVYDGYDDDKHDDFYTSALKNIWYITHRSPRDANLCM